MAQAAGRGKLDRQPPLAGLHRRLRPVRQRRARHRRVRRRRAEHRRGGQVVGQEPHRRAGHRRLRRGADQRRLARGDATTARSRGEGAMNYDADMPPYIQDMADWLDDDAQGPPLQLRERLQGLRDHDGALPLGRRRRPGRPAARRGRGRDRGLARARSAAARSSWPTPTTPPSSGRRSIARARHGRRSRDRGGVESVRLTRLRRPVSPPADLIEGRLSVRDTEGLAREAQATQARAIDQENWPKSIPGVVDLSDFRSFVPGHLLAGVGGLTAQDRR